VIGGEENLEKNGRTPEEISERVITGFERAAVNYPPSDERGKKREANDEGKSSMGGDESRKGRRGDTMGAKNTNVLPNSFGEENGEEHQVEVIDVEHEANDEAEPEPLRQGTLVSRGIPVPEEEGHRKSGMRMGPRRIEIHIHRQRAPTPDSEDRQESPQGRKILAREAKRDEEGKETVERGAIGKGVAVRSREAVSRSGGAEKTGNKNTAMSEDQERRPEDGGADGEMVVEMARARAEGGLRLATGIEVFIAEGLVGRLVVVGKVKVVLDERGAGISVVANTITANPRIDKRKGKEE
jgi:hypothetical protein